jgi:pimeloyl-ACP methyl ester carboxylesterase
MALDHLDLSSPTTTVSAGEPSPGHGRFVVYLPGLDGTGRLLHRQSELHQAYQVQCIGYAQNRTHCYADLVGQVIEALERKGHGILLAESFGGAVALQVALERPELVERLVLVNTFAYFPRQALIRVLAAVGQFLPARPSHPATRAVRGPFFFSRDIPSAERQEWWERTADVPMHAYGWRFRLVAELDLRPRLHEIQTPTLVIAADDDRVVPVCAGRLLARLLPNATLLSLRVGHAALIHPKINIARLLREPRYWPSRKSEGIQGKGGTP